MKKTYQAPTIMVMMLHTESMVCGSMGNGNIPNVVLTEVETVDNVTADSRVFSIWGDDEEDLY